MNSKQRYLCRNCNYHFTTQCLSRGKPLELKRKALHLYLKGMGFNAISRVLKVSDIAVLKWINQQLQHLPNSVQMEKQELDMELALEIRKMGGKLKMIKPLTSTGNSTTAFLGQMVRKEGSS